MATLLLSAAGAALGSGFGGTVLGLSGAVIGRAMGATLGRAIDQRVLSGGSEPVETGRIDRMRLSSAGEGGAIPRLWGRMRIAGQIIWASQYSEESQSRRGGKGGGPRVTEYAYSVSLAFGLCEGEILALGRIWAEGEEIAAGDLTLRLYTGSFTQLPDPKIEAVEGAGQVPGFRGLAYVVIEDLDLSPWGNRVPQFSFEVIRNAQGPGSGPALSDLIRGVALIPGTGEYALATTPVHFAISPGVSQPQNSHSPEGGTDFAVSLSHLQRELPGCASVSLVVSWFGSDLRCDLCEIRPKVEQKLFDGSGMAWHAGGISRAEAAELARREGSPVYGGTPADAAVSEAIRAIRAGGQEVMFYPFILMEQLADNGLSDPWSGAADQPVLPWRGRITGAVAPGRPGTSDGTAAADAEVAAFFGSAAPGDFSLSGGRIVYSGPAEWRYRRFILHYAWLCHAAGGVDAFCIGSEMPGLTRLRGADGGYPAVAALITLAAEVRAILGPQVKISYAADWTEYGGYARGDDLDFPLDPLWASADIDFIGIDNYMPLSDWREGRDHADADAGWIYNRDYLAANVAGGEYYDWYYESGAGEAAQNRLPIRDEAYDEPWVYRAKDLRGWWENPHHSRSAGVRSALPGPWVPGSKPIRFTEFGCAAIDKGSNNPNRFLDLHSSESRLPRASNGERDDLIQMLYLQVVTGYWQDPAHNPRSALYDGPMIDMGRAHVWAWDARPFPVFPARSDLWSDAAAWARGHWLNGRACNQFLPSVIGEICASAGVSEMDASQAAAVLRGALSDQLQSGRATLQPLLQLAGVDAFDRDGALQFRRRRAGLDHRLDPALYAEENQSAQAGFTRAAEAESGSVIRLSHIEAEGSYEIRTAEARQPDDSRQLVAGSEFAVCLTGSEAKGVATRWLAETRIGRDTLRFALPPSRLDIGPGDRLWTPDGSEWRVEQAELTDLRRIEALRIEGAVYDQADPVAAPLPQRPFAAPVPVWPVMLDLPLITGAEAAHQPHIALSADPWPGAVGLWSGDPAGNGGGGFQLNRVIARPSVMGLTETELLRARPGLWDRGQPLRVKLAAGALESVTPLAVLNGANLMAIGDGTAAHWELFQFAGASLVAPMTWEISLRLRGQAGSDALAPEIWPAGSIVVLLDASQPQADIPLAARGLQRDYRFGALARGYDDPAVVQISAAFDGIGLRPLAVAHLRARGRAGEDLSLSWIRRGRIEADSWHQAEIPLGEESEAYTLRLLAGDTPVASYQTSSPSFEISAALQSALGLSAGFAVEVAQLSPRFGPGPYRRLLLGP